MVGSVGVYVAVTNISPLVNLAGVYQRVSNGQTVNVVKEANGLYLIDNVGGVPPPSTAIVSALFVQVDDTTMSFPDQQTPQGDIYGVNPSISMIPADTTFRYNIYGNGPFGTQQRVFLKQ